MERVHELVRRHGWNATAFQTLEPGYSYFFVGDDACVAYVDTGRAWVAAGAPLCAASALGGTAEAFVKAARGSGRRACFVGSEERLVHAARPLLASLRVAEQPVWDPQVWSQAALTRRSFREQLRRARAKGVRVREASGDELESGPTREGMNQVLRAWLGSRRVAPLRFLVGVEPFLYPRERASFVAEQDGVVVAFASAVPVPAREGWFLEDLVRHPSAPNGTTDLLVDGVMRWAAGSGCRWLTLGAAPLSGELHPSLRIARWLGRLFYDFDGLRAHKAKLRPDMWMPIHLSYPRGQGALLSALDTLAAFTGGDLLRFTWRTLIARRELSSS